MTGIRRRSSVSAAAMLMACLAAVPGGVSADPPALIHYQGRVVDGANLVSGPVALDFRIFTNQTGGAAVFHATDFVTAIDGLYSAVIGETVVSGSLDTALLAPQAWLEVTVNATTLTPRERILAVPYARQVRGLLITTNRSVVLNPEDGPNGVAGSNLLAVVGGGAFNTGVGDFAVVGGGVGNSAGEGSVVSGGAQNFAEQAFAVIGGGYNNLADAGAVISGGSNNVAGEASVVAGGVDNRADVPVGVIGGGFSNRVDKIGGTIGGGFANEVFDLDDADGFGTVAGGAYNRAHRSFGSVGGGYSNQAFGAASTVPGGYENVAGGAFSFAAGRGAVALHDHSFVWSDQSGGTLSTSATNQFLIGARGGVGINTPPGYAFHLRAPTPSIMIENSGNTPAYLRFKRAADEANDHYIAIGSAGQMVIRVKDADRMTIATNGFVGMGISNPTNRLHVAGTVQATAYITSSDRNLKENIRPVEPSAVLDKVRELPIATWSFREEPSGTHIGPMAQDFHAAFGFGNTDSGIATVDADGVALAAIQALAEENRQLREALSVLGQRLEALEAAAAVR